MRETRGPGAKKVKYIFLTWATLIGATIENRIYREELKESLGMNFVSPFQPEREFKVYKSCKCLQIICSRVHLYSMFPSLFISISKFLKLLNKLYNELGK